MSIVRTARAYICNKLYLDENSHNSYDSDDSDDSGWHYSYSNKTALIPLERSSSLDSSWPQIQKWLKQCQHKHPKCQGSGDRVGWLPSRLISIAGGVEDDPSVHLCDSSGIAPGAVYTTLSHCWGPDPAAVGITTTIDNIDQMKTSIPWKRLSKTFQDAIKITAKLGIQYLWIDSLCIIQGSKDDWEKEAGQMQDVYSNSFLNIAATGAPDGRVGCLFDRSPVFSKSTGITLSWDMNDKPSTYFPLVFVSQPELQETFTQEPLNNRAWVMQERILSPRMLNFTRHQMVWECNSKFIFEALPKPSRDDRTTPEIKMLSLVKESESLDRNSGWAVDQYNRDLHGFWWKVVALYAETSLTKNSDKLVAISGVATRLAALMSDNYCWGLWEKTLSRDLLWTPTRKVDPSVRLDPTIAPSWSWAS
ncbi:Heterokaryon incompatibility protein (HET) domain containing protein, partial [Hyaloscypha variabilis]